MNPETATPLTDKFAFGFSKPNVGDGVEICHHSNAEWRYFASNLERELIESKELVRLLEDHPENYRELLKERDDLAGRILSWDGLVFELTGNEGEDDSFEVLKQLVADMKDKLHAAEQVASNNSCWFDCLVKDLSEILKCDPKPHVILEVVKHLKEGQL